MPCPFFEPTSIAIDPRAPHARLPLLAEYDGFCHAGPTASITSPEWRFAGCNQGQGQERCPRFLSAERAPIRRFTVQAQTETTVFVLVSEELDHMPVRWRQVQYSVPQRQVLSCCMNICERAQIQAFCSSYLQRFP